MQQLFYSFLAMLSALIGTFVVLKFSDWAKKNSILLIGFAAGVMLSIAFVHLLPESVEHDPHAIIYAFVGFLAMFIIQHFIFFHPCHDDHCGVHLGTLSTFGLSLHSFFDGIVISIGFGANTYIGLMTTIAIMLHKLPDGITITGILMHSKQSIKKILFYSLTVALFTPVGTLAGLFFAEQIAHLIGNFLAFTSGTFIYLAASDLIPETHKASNKKAGICLILGVIIVSFLGHIAH
ncbi:MAG: ZIP family metal transporter [Endomicrobiaceae bacterium]|nr:ZIP family metal transporter [Endomicrobiaceae bacterium]